jgi:hypothetical protein
VNNLSQRREGFADRGDAGCRTVAPGFPYVFTFVILAGFVVDLHSETEGTVDPDGLRLLVVSFCLPLKMELKDNLLGL